MDDGDVLERGKFLVKNRDHVWVGLNGDDAPGACCQFRRQRTQPRANFEDGVSRTQLRCEAICASTEGTTRKFWPKDLRGERP